MLEPLAQGKSKVKGKGEMEAGKGQVNGFRLV